MHLALITHFRWIFVITSLYASFSNLFLTPLHLRSLHSSWIFCLVVVGVVERVALYKFYKFQASNSKARWWANVPWILMWIVHHGLQSYLIACSFLHDSGYNLCSGDSVMDLLMKWIFYFYFYFIIILCVCVCGKNRVISFLTEWWASFLLVYRAQCHILRQVWLLCGCDLSI